MAKGKSLAKAHRIALHESGLDKVEWNNRLSPKKVRENLDFFKKLYDLTGIDDEELLRFYSGEEYGGGDAYEMALSDFQDFKYNHPELKGDELFHKFAIEQDWREEPITKTDSYGTKWRVKY